MNDMLETHGQNTRAPEGPQRQKIWFLFISKSENCATAERHRITSVIVHRSQEQQRILDGYDKQIVENYL